MDSEHCHSCLAAEHLFQRSDSVRRWSGRPHRSSFSPEEWSCL